MRTSIGFAPNGFRKAADYRHNGDPTLLSGRQITFPFQARCVVTVEFGDYVGGPLAYDDYTKCKNCGKEYTNQAEIGQLVTAKRKRMKIAGMG